MTRTTHTHRNTHTSVKKLKRKYTSEIQKGVPLISEGWKPSRHTLSHTLSRHCLTPQQTHALLLQLTRNPGKYEQCQNEFTHTYTHSHHPDFLAVQSKV